MKLDQADADKILSCFYETSDDCVKVVDTSGILKSFNSNGLKIMEIDDPEDVIGKSWLNFWKNDMNRLATEAFTLAASGQPAYFEGLCATFKGVMKHWQVSLVPITDDGGRVASILVTSKDSTKVLELEEKVRKLESEMSELKEKVG